MMLLTRICLNLEERLKHRSTSVARVSLSQSNRIISVAFISVEKKNVFIGFSCGYLH